MEVKCYYSLGHESSSQACDSVSSPTQSAPAGMGDGLVHVLVRSWVPSPQVTEHSIKSLHSLHIPTTLGRQEKELIITFDLKITQLIGSQMLLLTGTWILSTGLWFCITSNTVSPSMHGCCCIGTCSCLLMSSYSTGYWIFLKPTPFRPHSINFRKTTKEIITTVLSREMRRS